MTQPGIEPWSPRPLANTLTTWPSHHRVMDKVLDCSLEVNEFKLQLHYYVHFQTNTLVKDLKPLILPVMG